MLWIAIGAFLLDRLSKIWAFGKLRSMSGGSFSLWPNVLHLTYAENQGMAFGMLSGQRFFLILVPAIICVGGLGFLVIRGKTLPRFVQATGWLLLGGALGNLYDRLIHGFVIDMIEIRLFQFAIFNLADSFVCVAGGLLACWLLFTKEGKHARI